MRHLLRVILALVAMVTLAFISTPARAIPTAAPIVVTIERFTPVNPQPGKSLHLTGRVVNTSNDPLASVRVRLRLSPVPLTNRDDVGRIARGEIGPTENGPDQNVFDWVSTDVTEELVSSGETSFDLRVPLDGLGLSAPGVYVLAVEALASGPTSAYPVRVGLTRTFLPWFPDSAMQTADGAGIARTGLVWLWPLSDWPARDANGVLLNDRTPAELAPGGRLDALLNTAAAHAEAVSWLLDAELLQTARNMTDGYQLASTNGPVPGDGVADARRWLETLIAATAPIENGRRTEPKEQTLFSLPYANIDASASRRAGLEKDVVRAVTMSPNITGEILDRRVSQNVFWAPAGVIDQLTAETLATAGVNAFVLADTALPPSEKSDVTPSGIGRISTGAGDVKAILRDTGLTASLAMPAHTQSEVVLARQRFLAELGVVTMQDPGNPRTLVIGPNNVLWDVEPSLLNSMLGAATQAPYVRSTSLAELLQLPANSMQRDRVRYSTANRNAELSDVYLARVKNAQAQLAQLSSVVDDPAGVTEPMSQALLRAQSAAWRSEPATGERLLRTSMSSITKDIEQVRILSKGAVTFSGDTGIVPVTIANDFDREVTVGLQLTGQPSLRLESTPVQGISIAPGKNATVEVPVRVIGGGTLQVSMQLLTADGAAYGKPTFIALSSTAYARAAAWVIGLAFAAIAVFVVVGITRRIRASASTKSSDESGNLDS